MIYKSTSIENVISRILRNTKITDSSAINDMFEWIPEAMEMLQTQYELEPRYEDVDIHFHQGVLPCGINLIKAVEWNGARLRSSVTSKNPQVIRDLREKDQHLFKRSISGEQLNPVTGDYFPFLAESLQAVVGLPEWSGDYYQIKMDAIVTSFPEGKVRIHYLGVPLDENGFPLIPDNSNYKEAIYYYVRGKLIASGTYNDPILSFKDCLQLFEVHAGRAINEITWPSVDRMHNMVLSQVRMIKPVGYWEDFEPNLDEEYYG